MLRIVRRTALMFGAYVSPLLAAIVAGFLAGAVGIWAAVLWGVAVLAALALFGYQRLRQPPGDE